LDQWQPDIDRAGLIAIARPFEGGKTASDIVYDREVDEKVHRGIDHCTELSLMPAANAGGGITQ
jgi:hypothetical protein